MKRASGILLHITSLPSPHGVGTLGQDAFAFVDFLKKAGQSYWQMLPITPTGYGDSPYQSNSTFAGNPYLIDLDTLVSDGLLDAADCDLDWGDDPTRTDYGKLWALRLPVLKKAFLRFDRAEMAAFCGANADWLPDYALFCAAKAHFSEAPWYAWPDEALKRRTPEALALYRERLREDCAFYCFVQYLFDRQWTALHAYAAENGVSLIGDVPMYVPLDSADTWASPHLFQLDETFTPTLVAGVPPDYFTELGQLWGNPVYAWDAHRDEGFAWWIRRIGAMARKFETVRIDHFRGLESFWSVPYGAADARPGQWYPGPGMDLVRAIKAALPSVRIIAEDLGYLTPEVKKLLSESGFPGMRVMQFGFSPSADSRELPHNYCTHCVAYTGTHDNSPIMGWVQTAAPQDLSFAIDYLGLNEREGLPFGFARGLLTSVAELAILQLQDYLGEGDDKRMNWPGTMGWWTYRAARDDFSDALAARIRAYTKMSGRI